jgi:hypothetical protein
VDGAQGSSGGSPVESAPVDLADDILQGELGPVEIHWDDATGVLEKVEELWSALAPYAQGLKQVGEQDKTLVQSAGQLRDLLEAVYASR